MENNASSSFALIFITVSLIFSLNVSRILLLIGKEIGNKILNKIIRLFVAFLFRTSISFSILFPINFLNASGLKNVVGEYLLVLLVDYIGIVEDDNTHA